NGPAALLSGNNSTSGSLRFYGRLTPSGGWPGKNSAEIRPAAWQKRTPGCFVRRSEDTGETSFQLHELVILGPQYFEPPVDVTVGCLLKIKLVVITGIRPLDGFGKVFPFVPDGCAKIHGQVEPFCGISRGRHPVTLLVSAVKTRRSWLGGHFTRGCQMDPVFFRPGHVQVIHFNQFRMGNDSILVITRL